MTHLATMAPTERRDLLEEAAGRTGLSGLILEKDFWVVWCLARLFEDPVLAPHLLFKGGTSLAKVFHVIQRFSEDVDLGVHPHVLGFAEQDLVNARSKTHRGQLHTDLQQACSTWVRDRLQPHLEAAMRHRLGRRPEGDWLEFHGSGTGDSPELRFRYPTVVEARDGYIAKRVKLELGSLTDQRPTGTHPIEALLAEPLRAMELQDIRTSVTALGIERTFWEKATILHAEFHRPVARPMPDRYARHYVDFAALWTHPGRARALDRIDVLWQVAQHKQMFFPSGWANYDGARKGSLRLSPPVERRLELRRDFETMRPMFLGAPPDFEGMLATIATAERTINGA